MFSRSVRRYVFDSFVPPPSRRTQQIQPFSQSGAGVSLLHIIPFPRCQGHHRSNFREPANITATKGQTLQYMFYCICLPRPHNRRTSTPCKAPDSRLGLRARGICATTPLCKPTSQSPPFHLPRRAIQTHSSPSPPTPTGK